MPLNSLRMKQDRKNVMAVGKEEQIVSEISDFFNIEYLLSLLFGLVWLGLQRCGQLMHMNTANKILAEWI